MARSDFLMRDFHLEKQKSKIPISFTGKVDGYYTVVDIKEGGYSVGEYAINIGLSSANNDFSELINKLNEKFSGKSKPFVIEIKSNQLWIVGNIPLRKKAFEEHLSFLINQSIAELKGMDIQTGDFLYGDSDGSVSLYQVDNTYMFLSDRSYKTIKEDLDSRQFGEGNKKSIQNGIGGAFLGALIGAVLWGILLYIGFYGWFAGIIGVHLAFTFYRKNNGLFNLPGVLSVVGIVVLTLALANYLVYSVLIYLSLQEFGFTFSIVVMNLIPILREAQLFSDFMFDLILGVGIAGLYGAAATYRIYQTSKDEGTIRKV